MAGVLMPWVRERVLVLGSESDSGGGDVFEGLVMNAE